MDAELDVFVPLLLKRAGQVRLLPACLPACLPCQHDAKQAV